MFTCVVPDENQFYLDENNANSVIPVFQGGDLCGIDGNKTLFTFAFLMVIINGFFSGVIKQMRMHQIIINHPIGKK